MTQAGPSTLPSSGTFKVRASRTLREMCSTAPEGKKRKREPEQLVGLKYIFKPASITTATPGTFSVDASGSKQMTFDMPAGGQQVFEAKEDAVSKHQECVLMWEEGSQSFTLHPVSTTFQLTLNRAASAKRSAPNPSKPPSVGSSSSSSGASSTAAPLAKRKTEPDEPSTATTGNATKAKRPRPSEVRAATNSSPIAQGSATKANNGAVARKSVPASAVAAAAPVRGKAAPAKTKAKAGGSAAAKKGKASASAAAGVPKGKIKSAEIIEDSDEEALGLTETGGGGSGGISLDDEFATMLGESLADDEPDDEDEEEEEEEEDDELGGATLVGGGGAIIDDNSEWL